MYLTNDACVVPGQESIHSWEEVGDDSLWGNLVSGGHDFLMLHTSVKEFSSVVISKKCLNTESYGIPVPVSRPNIEAFGLQNVQWGVRISNRVAKSERDPLYNVSDPDLDWIRIQMSQQIWSRMGNLNPVPSPRKAKFVPPKVKKLRNFMFEDLSYSGAWKSFVGLYEIKMTHSTWWFLIKLLTISTNSKKPQT